MKQKFLLSLALTVTVHAALHQLTLSTAPPPQLSPLPESADNETIYQISEQLCCGCAGEEPLQYLYEHNLVRAKKSLPPLAWDTEVAAYAAEWAVQRKHDCEIVHSKPPIENDVGENIYWGSGEDWKPGDAVKAWEEEEKFYDYETNTCQEGEMCGHYTQLVWNTTEKLGCAQVHCDTGDMFITCNYSPPGNYEGEKPY